MCLKTEESDRERQMQKQFCIGLHKSFLSGTIINQIPISILTFINFYSSMWQLHALLPWSLAQINVSISPNSLTLASSLPGTAQACNCQGWWSTLLSKLDT